MPYQESKPFQIKKPGLTGLFVCGVIKMTSKPLVQRDSLSLYMLCGQQCQSSVTSLQPLRQFRLKTNQKVRLKIR